MKHELSVVTLTTTSVPPRRTTPPSAFTKCQPLVVSIRGAEIRPPPEQPTTQAAPRRTADIFFCGSVTLDWALASLGHWVKIGAQSPAPVAHKTEPVP